MSWAILSMDGLAFIFRWVHFMAGITWIGLLYYFNFVQGSFFNETDGTTKSNCVQKLVPRALWWFRWGAMFTLLSGLFMLLMKAHLGGWDVFKTSWGVAILTGGAFATLMWFNVWFLIWPNQKIVIQSALQVAQGGQALPDAANVAARAGLASRTNVLLSLPMLFFMGAASHLTFNVTATTNGWCIAGVVLAILAAVEFNAVKGKLGPLKTVGGVIHMGILFTVAMYVLLECLI